MVYIFLIWYLKSFILKRVNYKNLPKVSWNITIAQKFESITKIASSLSEYYKKNLFLSKIPLIILNNFLNIKGILGIKGGFSNIFNLFWWFLSFYNILEGYYNLP